MLQVYVSSVSVVLDVCFIHFICMFHVFYLYVSFVSSCVAKGSNVACVAMATHVCVLVYVPHVSSVLDVCCKCMF
jgi:hypothetical protein